ncbi:MAG: hypothetical protein WB816_09305 [Methylocystis sp.]
MSSARLSSSPESQTPPLNEDYELNIEISVDVRMRGAGGDVKDGACCATTIPLKFAFEPSIGNFASLCTGSIEGLIKEVDLQEVLLRIPVKGWPL